MKKKTLKPILWIATFLLPFPMTVLVSYFLDKKYWIPFMLLCFLILLTAAIVVSVLYKKEKAAAAAERAARRAAPATTSAPTHTPQKEPDKQRRIAQNVANTSVAPQEDTREFDALMTGQLIALYKKEFDKKYMAEYCRRLQRLGFTEDEAFNLFTNESMNMKHDSIALLQNPNYIDAFYFDLKHRILPMDNAYYIDHRMFCVSEITKLWDEAEWHYHNSHEVDMPSDVWHEIYMLTRYGGGELMMKTIEKIAESSGIEMKKLTKYAVAEQDMLFKYKWNKRSNERHPYH